MRTMLLLTFYICIWDMYIGWKANDVSPILFGHQSHFDLVLNLSLIERIITKLYEEMKRRRGFLFGERGKL